MHKKSLSKWWQLASLCRKGSSDPTKLHALGMNTSSDGTLPYYFFISYKKTQISPVLMSSIFRHRQLQLFVRRFVAHFTRSRVHGPDQGATGKKTSFNSENPFSQKRNHLIATSIELIFQLFSISKRNKLKIQSISLIVCRQALSNNLWPKVIKNKIIASDP